MAPTSRSGSPSPFKSTIDRVGMSDEPWAAGPRTSISQTGLGVVPSEPAASPFKRQNQMPGSRSSGTTSSTPLAVNRFTSAAKSRVRDSSTTAPVRAAGAPVLAPRSQRRRGLLDAMRETEIGEIGRGAVTLASSFVPPANPS